MGLRLRARGLLQFWLLAASGLCSSSLNVDKFVIVSAPTSGKISYMRVQKGGTILTASAHTKDSMEVLIGGGLVHPQGLAVNQFTKSLLVADPDAQQVLSYPLSSGSGLLVAGAPSVLASGIEARWVAVDAVGNVFFTDESRSQILKISKAQVRGGNSTPAVVYDGTSLTEVSAPGGLAVDNFHTFWVNKQLGSQVGSVIRGAEEPKNIMHSTVATLSKNADKSYGVCLASNNVYYTQPESIMYGVKKTGGEVQTISDRFTNPRGCAWDGDGTVYVADRGSNAVYSFSGNMEKLSAVELTKLADFEDAFGVAVFSGTGRLRPSLAALLGAAALAVAGALQAALAR